MSAVYPAELVDGARALLSALQKDKLKVATAESCTGGLLAGLITEIPGSSATLERGFVTYSNAAKTDLLGVDAKLITDAGAVSDEVARAMADGALANAPVDIAVAVTGIAGPDGGTPDKPVGLVYLAVARIGHSTIARECRFGDTGRDAIRLASLREALALIHASLI